MVEEVLRSQSSLQVDPLIQFAAKNGLIGLVKCLLEKGANAQAGTSERPSALHLAIEGGHLHTVLEMMARGTKLDSHQIATLKSKGKNESISKTGNIVKDHLSMTSFF